MNRPGSTKVSAAHLQRRAYLYVRQSTLRQVVENTESTQRQYQLRQRAVALGWPEERIITIDSDLGQSGASAAARTGFQRLVAEVSLERAGIVLGLEVSRLARNSSDWHRLLELCAHSRTLILDEEGVYDPNDFNDRLLLGLKGTMSEAELHVIRSRLRGGILNKARRGALRIKLPIGLCYDLQGQVMLDPDRQVRETVELFFNTFHRLGAAVATVRYFRDHELLFPRRNNGGPRHDELVWGRLNVQRAAQLLHNPRYAGCYVFGRYRHRRGLDGTLCKEQLPPEQWISQIQDAHPGYISWEQYQQNLRTLTATAKAYGQDRRHGPPREGPALLQGKVICGRCGTRMTVRYHRRQQGLVPDYACINRGPTTADSPCQVVPGAAVDEAVGQLLVESVRPETLQIALAVERELERRLAEIDRQRQSQVQRAQYEADLARQRFMKVDPQNRLVADQLEADWNEKLRRLERAQQECEEARTAEHHALSEDARAKIANLATEFPTLWRDPRTSAKARKRMLALLIEDVTLLKAEDELRVHVRFPGGATQTLRLPAPLTAWQARATKPDVLALINELLDDHPDHEVAPLLNQRGLLSGAEQDFTVAAIQWVRFNHGLKSYKQRLRERGYLTTAEICEHLGVGKDQVRTWRRKGYLKGRACNARSEWMYRMPEPGSLPTRIVASPKSAIARPNQSPQQLGEV